MAGAQMAGAILYETLIAHCADLHEAVGLDEVVHRGASAIDRATLARSAARLPEAFLLGVGYASDEVAALRRAYG
jgi:hypothetical protein